MKKIRIGVVGLGKAFMIMLPTLLLDERVSLTAAVDTDVEACTQLLLDFPGARVYESVERMCRESDVDLIYVATPHQYHAEHVMAALSCGRHVLVEKPMALTRRDCDRLIEAARRAGVYLMEGHSHSFDTPIGMLAGLLQSGRYGKVRMIHAMNYTDFLFRPRRPEELRTQEGGGVIFNQAPHQISIARRLAAGRVEQVSCLLGRWDAERPTEGAYCAQLAFDNGVLASLTYSGYAHYDSDELLGSISELGTEKKQQEYGRARRALSAALDMDGEQALKNEKRYGRGESAATLLPPRHLVHQHFGHWVISCDEADLVPTPTGIEVFGHTARERLALPPVRVPRKEVIDEIHAAIHEGVRPFHDGEWARGTMEICLAMLGNQE